jgi:hypothetical protein
MKFISDDQNPLAQLVELKSSLAPNDDVAGNHDLLVEWRINQDEIEEGRVGTIRVEIQEATLSVDFSGLQVIPKTRHGQGETGGNAKDLNLALVQRKGSDHYYGPDEIAKRALKVRELWSNLKRFGIEIGVEADAASKHQDKVAGQLATDAPPGLAISSPGEGHPSLSLAAAGLIIRSSITREGSP